MNYEGLLAFIAIALAVYQLADPVRRVSIDMFVSKRTLLLAVALSFVALFAVDLAQERAVVLPSLLPEWLLRAVAFAVPALAIFAAFRSWRDARLAPAIAPQLSKLIRTALLEQRSDEVERVIWCNAAVLPTLPPSVLMDVFDQHLIRAFLRGRSLLHLDLISRAEVLKALNPPFEIAERLTRELLDPGLAVSPLRFEVLKAIMGGGNAVQEVEEALFASTYGNPSWYTDTAAHRALQLSAQEALWSGTLDDRYNTADSAYGALDGRPTRAACPVYRPLKVQTLALEATIDSSFDEDLYVTNLFWLFREILGRSRYRPNAWEKAPDLERPTPFAYLLYEIIGDLDRLSIRALKMATARNDAPVADHGEGGLATAEGRTQRSEAQNPNWTIAPPGRVAEQLALTWSFCTTEILTSQGNVSDLFKARLATTLIYFLINVAFEPSRLFWGAPPVGSTNLDAWRDLYLGHLRDQLPGSRAQLAASLGGLLANDLDIGRSNVIEGRDWLKKELGFD